MQAADRGAPTDTASRCRGAPDRSPRRGNGRPAMGRHQRERRISQMKRLLLALLTAGTMIVSTAVQAQDHKTLGIVALLANDALNIAVIGGATDAAKAA